MIEGTVKQISTDQVGIEQESREAKSFGLKNLTFSISRETSLINRKHEKLEF